MKINEVTAQEANYETGDGSRKLAAIGRVIMDKAVTTKDDELSNTMAKVGDELTRYNTAYGARSVEELLKKTGASKELLMKLMKFGEATLQKSGDPAKGADVADEPADDDSYGPSDADIDAKAKRMAMAKR